MQFKDLIEREEALKGKHIADLDKNALFQLKRVGFSDRRLATLLGTDQHAVRAYRQALNVRSIHYAVEIETIKLLTGESAQVPALKSLADTPVTLEVSVDIIQAMHLLQYFNSNGVGDKVNYNFSAVIDFSAWLPALRVDKKGALPLSLQP